MRTAPTRDEMLAQLDGDADLLHLLCGIWLEQFGTLLADAAAALERGDAPALRHAAHTLKGSSGALGAKHVVERSGALERVAASGSTGDDARNIFLEVKEAAEALRDVLQSLP